MDFTGNPEPYVSDVEDSEDDEFFDDPDLHEFILQKRKEMEQQMQEEQKKIQLGTGIYREIIEKDFLEHTTSFENVIVHFFSPDFVRCKILDSHLEKMARTYLNVRFLKINALNAEFFVLRLKIQTLPQIIMFRDGKIVDRLVGFEELGGSDHFPTSVLEKRIERSGLIKVKTIRSSEMYQDDDDADWE